MAAIAFWNGERNGRHAHRIGVTATKRNEREKSGVARSFSKLSCRKRRANPHGTSFQRHPGAKVGAGRVTAERDSLDRAEVGRPALECSSHTSCVLFDPRTSVEDRLVVVFAKARRPEGRRRTKAVERRSRLCRNRERNICRNENTPPRAPVARDRLRQAYTGQITLLRAELHTELPLPDHRWFGASDVRPGFGTRPVIEVRLVSRLLHPEGSDARTIWSLFRGRKELGPLVLPPYSRTRSSRNVAPVRLAGAGALVRLDAA